MTIRKSERIIKEEKYAKVNKCPTSVCCGVHHIINQRRHETCSHCNICPKFIEYKRQGRKDFGDVKFNYVKSFRECKLYELRNESEKKSDTIQYNTKRESHNVISKEKQRQVSKAKAYMRLEKSMPELIMYTTWSELFAFCIMEKAVKDLDSSIRNNIIYKKEVKKKYNIFYEKFLCYSRVIKRNCFINGDNEVIEKIVSDMSLDFIKLRLSIENFINKFNVSNHQVMSYLILAMEVISEFYYIHNNNQIVIKKKEPKASICEFMSPKALIDPLNSVISQVSLHEGDQRVISLGDDMNIVNGLKVLRNKIRNPHIINEIVYLINDFHNNNNK